MIVALTGGTGSGKGFVANIFKGLGAYVVDADDIGHGIIKKGKPAYDEIVKYFVVENSFDILDEDGEIIRKKLGQIVFSDDEKLKVLNSCTHKHINLTIINQAKELLKDDKNAVVFIDIPLLEKGEVLDICDKVVVVFAPEDERINRIIKRDDIPLDVAVGRVNSQKKWHYYEDMADIVIDNSDGIQGLALEVENIFNELALNV